MYKNAYICPWCKKDIKGKEIPSDARREYDNDEFFTQATELYQHGFEHLECGCRWYYNGKIFKDGKEELKNKYKVKEIESVEENVEQPNTTENVTIENKEESEVKKDESKTTSK